MATRRGVDRAATLPIFDLPEGIATRPVVARDGKEAFEIGHRLFLGCRLVGVMREEGDDETP